MRLALRRFVAAPFRVITIEGTETLTATQEEQLVYIQYRNSSLDSHRTRMGSSLCHLIWLLHLPHFFFFLGHSSKHCNTNQRLEVVSIMSLTKSWERKTGSFGYRAVV